MIIRSFLQKISKSLNIMDIKAPSDLLKTIYAAAKEENPKYNVTLFSLDIGLGACNTASVLMTGSRAFTIKAMQKICRSLKISKHRREYLECLVTLSQDDLSPEERHEWNQQKIRLKSHLILDSMEKDRYQFFQHWYHAAILEMLRFKQEGDLLESLHRNLKFQVEIQEIERTLALLSNLSLVRPNAESGRLEVTTELISTGPSLISDALMAFHDQFSSIARHALGQLPPKERDFTSLTIAVNSSQFTEIVNELAQVRKKILAITRDPKDPDTVIQLNLQLFKIAEKVKDK